MREQESGRVALLLARSLQNRSKIKRMYVEATRKDGRGEERMSRDDQDEMILLGKTARVVALRTSFAKPRISARKRGNLTTLRSRAPLNCGQFRAKYFILERGSIGLRL